MIPSKDLFTRCRVFNGTTFLAKNNEVFELDEVGELVWDMLDGETEIDKIAEKIAEKYEVDRNIVWRDIQAFVNELAEKELIEYKK